MANGGTEQGRGHSSDKIPGGQGNLWASFPEEEILGIMESQLRPGGASRTWAALPSLFK